MTARTATLAAVAAVVAAACTGPVMADVLFEAEQTFSTKQEVQLFGNVENVQNWTRGCATAHYPGPADSARLSAVYTNLVVWRARPAGSGRTNIEQWGTRTDDNYDVDSEMRSELRTNDTTIVFDHIQVTFFRGGPETGDVVRDGVAPDEVRVGSTRVHVGVTRRAEQRDRSGVRRAAFSERQPTAAQCAGS